MAILFSAGVVESQKKFGSAYFYFRHQIINGVLPGFLLLWIFSKINFRHLKKVSLIVLLAAVALMVLVFVPGVGVAIKGAQRWVAFGPIVFQPAEFLKFALIIYSAAWFSRRDGKIDKGFASAIPFFLVLGFIGFLLITQPDMGTLVVVAGIAIAMYFFAGVRLTHFLMLLLVLGVLLGSLAVIAPYRFDRLKTFFNKDSDKQGSGYHINQALLGIGSGGLFGLGYGQSRQKLDYLPEPVGDSIFAIVVEELGLAGASVLILLFLGWGLTAIKIAKDSSSDFGRLAALGVLVWVLGQALINISAISGLIPLTGIPLPFVSYGSSSMVAILSACGVVMNVAKK